jgi:hypothetical protein
MIENPNVICNDCGFCKQNKELKDKCERLEKQLRIATEALGKYANKDNWQNHYTIDLNDWELELKVFDDGEVDKGEFYAQEALQQIKELENEKTPEPI